MPHKMLLFVLAILLLIPMSAQAQIPPDGLIAFSYGDLWTWAGSTAAARQMTTWGYNGGPILSPDGSRIAYLSWATETVEQLNNGTLQPPYASVPSNIWTMETDTEEYTRVANQGGANEFGIFRSPPAWSPDSTALVWAEVTMTQSSTSVRLVIYDFNTGTQRILTNSFDLGFQDVALYVPTVQWGEGGISRILVTFEGVTSQEGYSGPRYILEIFNPQSGVVSRYEPFPNTGEKSITGHIWMEGRVVMLDSTGLWTLLTPATGVLQPLLDPPYLRLKNGTGVVLTPQFISTDNFYGLQWQATYNNTSTILPIPSSYSIAGRGAFPVISPDGRSVAWNSQGTVTVWNADTFATQNVIISDKQNGENRYIEPASVAWGEMEWVSNIDLGDNACPLPARLSTGQTIVVNDGEPNVIRDNAGLSSNRTGEIRAGETTTVQQGPVCADGYNWYLVNYDGGSGWTAEGENLDYWLRPVNTAGTCWNSPAARLQNGMVAYVLPGTPNVIRSGAGIGADAPVIGNIPGGAQFNVTGDGVCANDGRRWYPITYNGQSGWTAEGEGDSYWVAPAG